MSPTAVGSTPGHLDSFTLPSQGEVKVHATAKRSPEGGLIQVESESTVYEEDGIRAKFVDRGAAVTSESADNAYRRLDSALIRNRGTRRQAQGHQDRERLRVLYKVQGWPCRVSRDVA
jgi:hypothetical protein